GGNGWGPMRQLGRFYEMLLAGGALDGHRVLLPQTVEALLARHRVGMVDHTFRQVMDWGLGFIPNSRPGLVETFAALRQLEDAGAASGAAPADATADASSSAPPPPDVELPYHYG